MNRKFSVGIIGLGRMGKIHTENILRHISNVELKCTADINISEQLKKWAESKGFSNIVDDPNILFEDPSIDAVIIASSTDSHTKLIQNAAKNKKQIFCEKPLDFDVKRVKETIRIIEEEGVKLMVGFNRRFDHNFMRLHEAVISGQIGSPQIIKITSRDPAPPPIEYIKGSGGLFFDMTIHDWDMASYLAGSKVVEVYASGAVLIDPRIGEAGDIDTAAAMLKFKNGALGLVDNTRQAVYGYDQRVEVFGSKGCIIADNELTNTVRTYKSESINIDKIPYFFLERYMQSYATELEIFFNSLRKDENPKPDGNDCLQNILVAMAANKSLKENRPIKISEIAH